MLKEMSQNYEIPDMSGDNAAAWQALGQFDSLNVDPFENAHGDMSMALHGGAFALEDIGVESFPTSDSRGITTEPLRMDQTNQDIGGTCGGTCGDTCGCEPTWWNGCD